MAIKIIGYLRISTAQRYLRIAALTLLIIWTSPLNANDLGGLSSAFSRAQQMVDEFRRSAPPQRQVGRNWDDYVDYSEQSQRAAQEATQRLADVEAQLNTLDVASRAYLEQSTTEAERSSLATLMETITRLQQQARSRQQELQTRLAELRARMQTLRAKLAELDLESDELRASGAAMNTDLARLQSDSVAMAQRAERLKNTERQASALADELQASANAARIAYWNQLGDLFARLQLGTPRDYTQAVVAAPATTQRRVHRTSTMPTVVPPLALPLSPQSIVPLAGPVYALPLAAAAAPASASPPTLSHAVTAWVDAARTLHRAQNEADALLDGVQATEVTLLQRAEKIKAASSQVIVLRSAVAQAATQLNRHSYEVEALQIRIPDTLARGLGKLGEGLFWAHAQAGLEQILRGVSHHAELAAHFTWVMRSYSTLLREDLPTVVELLGPDPSEEALAKFERLTHLTEAYLADRESSLILAQLTSRETARTEAVAPLDSTAVYRRQKANLDEFIRQTKLGFDAAKNKFVLSEADAALRVEKYLGRQIERATHRGEDWHLASDKNFTLDLMRPVAHPQYSQKEFSEALQRHLAPARQLDQIFIEFPPDLPADKRDAIRRIVKALPGDERSRVVFLD